MTVFISYARENQKIADEVASNLRAEKYATWIDYYMLGGDEWKNVIDQELKNCYAVIVIVTEYSMKSHYVTYEWSFALALGKRIIPVVCQKSDSHWKIHPKLDDRNYLNFVDNRDWIKLYETLNEAKKRIINPR